MCHESQVILPADLGLPAEAWTAPGVQWLDAAPTDGRFPTGLSVSEVTAVEHPDGTRRLQRNPIALERIAFWAAAVETLPAIREVRSVGTAGIDPRGATHLDLLRASQESGCRLCLIYALVRSSETEADFVGALWDAELSRALATFRATAETPADILVCYEEDDDDRRKWRREAEYCAVEDFSLLVRAAVWEMAARDMPTDTVRPNPWEGGDPLLPRDLIRWLRFERALRPRR